MAFTAPGAYRFDTVTGTNANAAVDSIVNTAGQTAQVAVVAGANTPNQNAGIFLGGTFTTHVYIDTNKDSSQATGEANAAGVTVNLLNSAGTPTGVTAITDANGNVSFTGLIPGSYAVSVVTPAGDTVTQATNVGTQTVISSGGTATAVEGLFIPGALSGHIFVDGNDNGVQDTGDTNLAGVTVTLLNSSSASTGVTAVTDANGFYQFTGLIPGSYAVAFAKPAGYSFDTLKGTNANAAVDSIVNTAGQTTPVAVVAGAATPNQNAGVFVPAPGIQVTKTANVSSAAAGAQVTYTYSVYNNGSAPVSSLVLTDNGGTSSTTVDDFSPTYISGDTNKNAILDPGETWSYSTSVAPPQGYVFSGQPTSDGAVSGNAFIEVRNGYMIVSLTNTAVNIRADGQEITNFAVELGSSAAGASLGSAAGALIKIGAGGVVIADTVDTITGWTASASGNSVSLSALNKGKPSNLIIGSTDVNGYYSNANSSVTQHQPAIQGTGTFVIAVPGLTSSTAVKSFAIGFGTTPGATITGTLTPTVVTNTVKAAGVYGSTTVNGTAQASVTVGAAAPSAKTNLFNAYTGSANQFQFQYGAGSTVATLSENTIAGVTGSVPGTMAFVVITDKSGDFDASSKTFFSGNAASGSKLVADASSLGGFSTAAGSFLYAHVFSSKSAYDSKAAAIQEIKYEVNGAHAIALGDTVGSLTLVGYASTTNQGYFS